MYIFLHGNKDPNSPILLVTIFDLPHLDTHVFVCVCECVCTDEHMSVICVVILLWINTVKNLKYQCLWSY